MFKYRNAYLIRSDEKLAKKKKKNSDSNMDLQRLSLRKSFTPTLYDAWRHYVVSTRMHDEQDI